ncbi:MAG: peptidylprolyl isomerase [Bacteroidales bacterium]|jgi:peptidyl-prolyl cis-trans isomerase SurA|nr:peptidylprolyl isomerase [Bacteroidales bacterium]MEE0882849.1 peptidylprolyl isomerase [Bacteroidales bacterium]MEE1111686.1 peptidylprolyl isomerase [Bacteroidales bacterium]MEE1221531.1 peptidylprolyl isomerase [Bacteroidales bacterium]MEE1253031.1 peptidylprolyl isomerase [Bacteroidales bacterium]
MKKLFSLSVLISMFNFVAIAQNTGNDVVVDKVIAIVGQNMIKQSELEGALLQQKMNSKLIIEDEFATKCDLLEGMLINKLMLHQAEVDSIEVTDDEVNREMDNRIRYMISAYGSQENLERQMRKSLSEIKDYFKDVIRDNIMISQIEQKLTGTLSVTPQEVVDFYNSIPKDSLPTIEQEYEFSQIVKIPQISEEEKESVKARLNDYRERILKGTKFSTIATLYSEDPASAKKGGELGFFSRGDMVGEFENAAFALQDGEISPIIETKYGFHIIQMIERRGNQVNCRHILLQPKVTSQQLGEAYKELEEIKEKIDKGEITFEEAIVKYSDDPSKVNQGLIVNPYNASAIFTKDVINETMSNIEKVDFNAMKQGEITKPVKFKTELSEAYRLIKVNRKTDAHKVDLTLDYDKVQASALDNKKTEIIKEWANKRLKKTYVKIDADYQSCDFKLNWTK